MSDKRAPDFRVERLALGELSPEVAAATRARLMSQPSESQRLSDIEADNQATLILHPPAAVAAEVNRRRSARRWKWRLAAGLPLLAAVAAAALALAPVQPLQMPALTMVDLERAKGGAGLTVHQSGVDQPLALGAEARAGDVVQVRCSPRGAAFGVIASVDGRGAVTLHFPEVAGASTALSDGAWALPHAYALDDAPRFERFFLVTAATPIEVSMVLAALDALGSDASTAPLALPEGLEQTDFLLRKTK